MTAVIKRGGVRMHALTAAMGASVEPDARARADSEREEQHRRAIDEAYQRGWADGQAAAERDGAGAIPALVTAIEQGTADVVAAMQTRTEAESAALSAAAIDIAEWVLGQELPEGRVDTVIRVRNALTKLVPSATITIQVADQLTGAVREWTSTRTIAGFGFEVVGDTNLRPGEALITAGYGTADLTFAGALARVRSELDEGDTRA